MKTNLRCPRCDSQDVERENNKAEVSGIPYDTTENSCSACGSCWFFSENIQPLLHLLFSIISQNSSGETVLKTEKTPIKTE